MARKMEIDQFTRFVAGMTLTLFGYYAGLETAKARRKQERDKPLPSPDGELPTGPTPELPPLPPPPTDGVAPLGTGVDYSPLWAAIDFDTEIYPAGADETRVRPPSPEGLVASADCNVIALASKWWDAVGLFAATNAFGRTDGDAVSRRVIQRWLPKQCHSARTSAAGALRAEIRNRLAELASQLVFTQPAAAPI